MQVYEPFDAGKPEAGARVVLGESPALELQKDRAEVTFVDSAAQSRSSALKSGSFRVDHGRCADRGGIEMGRSDVDVFLDTIAES